MIEKIHITGFQAHERRVISFDPHVTMIVGPSDVGKSSIVRALEWVCFNRPAGLSYVREDSVLCRVKLWVDGHKITRLRSSSRNLYKLDDQVFEAFGNDVPPPIAELLNVSRNNFQSQHDQSFWFSLTPGQVSKELNSIVNLGVIDSSLANISSAVRKANDTVNISQERLDMARVEKKELAWVPEMGLQLKTLETQWERVLGLQAQAHLLEHTIKEIRQHRRTVRSAKGMTREIKQLVGMAEGLDHLSSQIATVSNMLDAIKRFEDEKCQKKKQAEVIRDQLARVGNCPLCGSTM